MPAPHYTYPYDDEEADLDHARIDGAVGLAGALALALCAAGVAGGAVWTARTSEPRQETVELSVGLGTVRVREDWVRGRASRAPAEPVEIIAPFGELVPDAPAALQSQPVLITLAPADRSMPPQDRPRHLYARFLSAEARPAEGGLIRRRFRPGTPYDGEDLYLAPPDGRAFSARCLDRQAGSPVTASCVAEMRLGRIDAQMRVTPALLGSWEVLAAAVRERFGGEGPARGRGP